MRNRSLDRTGYVLLMVLVLLIVLATALTSIASRTMQTTHEAVVAVAQLQQRVGLESCQKAILLRAEFAFKKLEASRRDGQIPVTSDACTITSDAIVLGDQRFDLVLSDENAKVNLNTVNQNAGQDKIMKILRDTLPFSIARTISFHPAAGSSSSPTRGKTSASGGGKGKQKSKTGGSNSGGAEPETFVSPQFIPAFRSWGEVFDFGMLIGQSPDKQVQLDFTRSFTLWGSGNININRATDAQISMLLETAISAAESKKVLRKLRENPDISVEMVVEKELTSPVKREQVKGLLNTASFAYSLFIDVETPQCRSRKLFVNTLDPNGVQQILEFVFH